MAFLLIVIFDALSHNSSHQVVYHHNTGQRMHSDDEADSKAEEHRLEEHREEGRKGQAPTVKAFSLPPWPW